ncbi:MAG TPA: J domain-containing protein [Balneolales bacterium]|nr:J domain-containing protein [Balneolales bacterium]
MEYKDYYKILGVGKDASKSEIKKAYRKLAAKYHPDVNQDDKNAQKKFTDVQEAYEVLSDPEKRKWYDKVGANWKQYQQAGGRPDDFDWSRYAQQGQGRTAGGPGTHYEFHGDIGDIFGSGGFSDFFENIFGGMSGARGARQKRRSPFDTYYRQRQRAGRDIEAEIIIGLQEAYSGSSRSFELNGQQMRVKIPRGIKDGQRLKLKGKGNPGFGGGPSGDLYLRIKIQPNDKFERKGDDLYSDVPVDLYTMLIGGKIVVPTIGGSIKLTIPEGTQNGKLMRLKGQGMPKFGSDNEYGDLYVKLMVKLPTKLSREEKEMIKRISQKHPVEN